MSQVAHQAGVYPGFCSIKRLLLPGLNASPSQGYPSIKFAGTHLYNWVKSQERDIVRVKCLAQEHNTMSPARTQTWTARSGDERISHSASATKLVHDPYDKTLRP